MWVKAVETASLVADEEQDAAARTEKVRVNLPNRRSKRRRKPASSSACSGAGRSPLMTSSRSSFRAWTCAQRRASPV